MERVWIKTTRNEPDQPGEWAFGKCIWAPRYDKRGGDRYGHIRGVAPGHRIVHLLDSYLTGVSTVAKQAQLSPPPPNPSAWRYAKEFYRVELTGYTDFPRQLSLDEFISEYDQLIREDIELNRPKRYPFAIYHYYRKPTKIKAVRGRPLTVATDTLTRAISEATRCKSLLQ